MRNFYDQAQPRLRFSILRFNQQQIGTIAAAFAAIIMQHRYTCYACAILSDHVHIVIRKHKHRAEDMIDALQKASRWRLSSEERIPRDHPIWTNGGWKHFLNSPSAVRAVIGYVERNPIKTGLQRQTWPFAAPYDNWPCHAQPSAAGHG